MRFSCLQQLTAPDGSKLEAPDPWLEHLNPFEILRYDIQCEFRFCGQSERTAERRAVWSGGQEVLALACDITIPGNSQFGGASFPCLIVCSLQATEPKTQTTFVCGRVSPSVASISKASMVN